jgi:hypothetical protein
MPAGMTLGELIDIYQSDPHSRFGMLPYQSRSKHQVLLRRLKREHGAMTIANIDPVILRTWHAGWSDDGKLAIAYALISQLRLLSAFGSSILKDRAATRLKTFLSGMRFPLPKPRRAFLTAEHAIAVREKAHDWGWYSIAMAQAFQFEAMLSQKHVIGEWVPLSEPGSSTHVWLGQKWLDGLRWEAVDRSGVLRQSNGNETILMDIFRSPMIAEELHALQGRAGTLPLTGPIIVCEATGKPWKASEFRRKWRWVARAAGIPDELKNMDSRARGSDRVFALPAQNVPEPNVPQMKRPLDPEMEEILASIRRIIS